MTCREELNTLVGLCDYADPCFEGERPVNYDQSRSGFFLTDPEDGIPILAQVDAAKIGGQTVWEVLEGARKGAIADFLSDVNAQMRKRNTDRLQAYAGLIGSNAAGGLFPTSQPYAGIEIEAALFRGTYLELRKIGVALDTVGSFNLNIYKILDRGTPTLIHTESLTNTKTSMEFLPLAETKTLQLWDECQDLRYWVLLELPTNSTPFRSKITCCGNRPRWMQFGEVRGVTTDLITTQTNSYSYGVTLDAALSCKNLDWLCELDELDGHNLTLNIGKLIQWKSAIKLASSILTTTNINAFTLLGREALYGKRNYFRKRYQEGLEWLVSNVPSNLTDCWKCRPEKTFQKHEILI